METKQQTETAMILTPRQEHLQRVRDEMAPGEKPAAIVPHTFAEVLTMCQALATADLAPKALRGKATDMALVIMTGAEVGLPPMASLRLYTTWDGVPRLMAEGVRAIILQSPAIEYFEMATCDDNHATWIGKRRGRPEKSVTWTWARAEKAKLTGKENWQKYPQDMLNARASMQLGRIIAPDVVAGMVALEEARDGDFIDAQSVEARPVFVAPPAPQGPPPGVPMTTFTHPDAGKPTTGPNTLSDVPERAVTVTDTGMKPGVPVGAALNAEAAKLGQRVANSDAKPAEQPKRGPVRPPKAQPSQTPGTDPFRAAREAVEAREAQGRANLAEEINKVEQMQDAAIAAVAAERDKWGQSIADPTSGAAPSIAAPTPTSSSAPTSSPDAGPSPESSSTADDGFGGEDPADSQPAPTGDPGLQLIEDMKAFLAGCNSQTEMQNGRPPFARRSEALNAAGDKRFKAYDKTGPAGELAAEMGRLWADRKRQLPL